MPELPEVETLKRQLAKAVVAKTIKGVKVLRAKSFLGNPQQIIGKKILKVDRRAKILIIKLNRGIYLAIHLKLTGQLIYETGSKRTAGGHPTLDWVNQLPSQHTRVIIDFKDSSRLYFNDQRVFGWIKIVTSIEDLVSNLGMEPLDKEFTLLYLKDIFSRSGRAVKLLLLDQQKIAGIGNIYANDALFLAGIDPRKPAKKLTLKEMGKLRRAIIKVLKDGIKYGGASENTYKHLDGLGGKYQEHFLVYQQDGQKCGQCGSLIKRIKIGGRGTFFCPKCQK